VHADVFDKREGAEATLSAKAVSAMSVSVSGGIITCRRSRAGRAHHMGSGEIAELTGKRHDHVMTDIRKMLGDLYGKEDVERALPKHSPNLGN
jgi:hypothetical protein